MELWAWITELSAEMLSLICASHVCVLRSAARDLDLSRRVQKLAGGPEHLLQLAPMNFGGPWRPIGGVGPCSRSAWTSSRCSSPSPPSSPRTGASGRRGSPSPSAASCGLTSASTTGSTRRTRTKWCTAGRPGTTGSCSDSSTPASGPPARRTSTMKVRGEALWVWCCTCENRRFTLYLRVLT